ncbi:kinase-like domain-containing protein [Gigaspora rosea]|uniref:non-specific serine/threonine protein kinase n=1 Tax=Gigaspora rosea TaxID=44941 RepID=A0A397TUR5_9GLOM|nr:kinase-like domain-containing protein [Gigaspora rosea]
MGAGCCREEEIDFDAEVELSHFHLLRSVGKGAFGKVRVVQHKRTKIIYALKYINKAKCIKMRAVENIIQERRLLEEIEYPLVCNLRYAFQDDENLFMVLDLMLGGDLRFHLERQAFMKEDVVKFYVAEVSLGLNYLHSKKIVHRDLKPDNVLLDEKGHAHLTDFNIAVHFNERKPLTSVAGSMAYMAPEVLTKQGYLNSVDWWSLGVIMYELLFSKRPFRGKTNVQLTHAILHDPLQFPDNVYELVSRECIDCLKRFCERDVNKRLGCGPNGLEDIKRHPWFKDIEWDKLDTKQAKAPFIPDSKRANFDATHELEELLLEDNPLKAKKRANPNQDLSELSKEMRMMEEKFLIYDFTKMCRRSYYINPPDRSVRRRSERSSGSTTVDRMMNNHSGATSQLDNVDTDPLNIQHPSMVKLPHARTESDLTAVGY